LEADSKFYQSKRPLVLKHAAAYFETRGRLF